ncbi:hypothetical protein ABIF90_009557 [Bradyrhizobium japonicum]
MGLFLEFLGTRIRKGKAESLCSDANFSEVSGVTSR